MKRCIYAGTFDPITKGHSAIITQAEKIFDEVLVVILVNAQKTPLFSLSQRLFLLNKLYQNNPKIKIDSYVGLQADYMREKCAPYTVRGIRDENDLKYECLVSKNVRKVYADAMPVLLFAPDSVKEISSTAVRTALKNNESLADLVDEKIEEDIKEFYRRNLAN